MGDLSLAKNLFIKLAIRCEFFIFFKYWKLCRINSSSVSFYSSIDTLFL